MERIKLPIGDQPSSNSSKESKRRKSRQRRRREDYSMQDFDQAYQFLQHFHSYASRSLDVIAEHSESGDDDEELDISISRMGKKRMNKAATCSCLTSLAHSNSSTTASNNATPLTDNNDEWGFYCEDIDDPLSMNVTNTKWSS